MGDHNSIQFNNGDNNKKILYIFYYYPFCISIYKKKRCEMFLDLDKIQTQQKIVKRQAVMPKKTTLYLHCVFCP